jgi:hypothetical protein
MRTLLLLCSRSKFAAVGCLRGDWAPILQRSNSFAAVKALGRGSATGQKNGLSGNWPTRETAVHLWQVEVHSRETTVTASWAEHAGSGRSLRSLAGAVNISWI